MEITYAKHTDVGERENNEDTIGCFYHEENGYCFVLADGLGGHGRGEDASQLVVSEFKKCFNKVNDKEDIINNGFTTKEEQMKMYFDNAFKNGQEGLEKLQDESQAIMDLKTTAVALTIYEDKAVWAHVGDSRLYVFNKNKVVKHTLDHSVPQMLVFAGEIKDKHIRNHPDRNRLLKVMGARDTELKYDISEVTDLKDCQAFLLCSDGFWENIIERKMCKFLRKSKSVEQWLQLMVDEVKKNGMGDNMDNNSAIAVWVK